jgi:hypothetical protein
MASHSIYEMDKQGTSQVVTWLGETAAQYGYNAFSTPLVSHPKTALKENAAPNNQAENAHGQEAKYSISMRELPILARFISEHLQSSSDLNELSPILEVLREVISMREQWAEKFTNSRYWNALQTRDIDISLLLEKVYQNTWRSQDQFALRPGASIGGCR